MLNGTSPSAVSAVAHLNVCSSRQVDRLLALSTWIHMHMHAVHACSDVATYMYT